MLSVTPAAWVHGACAMVRTRPTTLHSAPVRTSLRFHLTGLPPVAPLTPCTWRPPNLSDPGLLLGTSFSLNQKPNHFSSIPDPPWVLFTVNACYQWVFGEFDMSCPLVFVLASSQRIDRVHPKQACYKLACSFFFSKSSMFDATDSCQPLYLYDRIVRFRHWSWLITFLRLGTVSSDEGRLSQSLSPFAPRCYVIYRRP